MDKRMTTLIILRVSMYKHDYCVLQLINLKYSTQSR